MPLGELCQPISLAVELLDPEARRNLLGRPGKAFMKKEKRASIRARWRLSLPRKW